MTTTPIRKTLPKIVGIAFIIALLFSVMITPQTAQATSTNLTGPGWVVIASDEYIDNNDGVYGNDQFNAIYTMNTYTNEVHGPFLMDELTPIDESTGSTSGMDLFDVALTPDGKTALVSAFGAKTIYFVNITNPLHPKLLSSLKIDIFAEDIAVTADGRYALVTDGGYTQSVYSIDIRNHCLVYELLLPTFDHDANGNPVYGATNAVAIAPDGTVVMADYFNAAIHTLRITEDGALIYTGTHRHYLSSTGAVSLTPAKDYMSSLPVNVAISPDGKTVLVSDTVSYVDHDQEKYTDQYAVAVYQITQPGKLVFEQVVTGLPRTMQTIAFTETGDRAIMLGNHGHSYDESLPVPDTYFNDGLYVMDILGPGQVEFNPDLSTDLKRSTSAQLFGVDGLAIYEGKAYASYSVTTLDSKVYPERYLSVVDLDTFELTQVDWGPTNTRIPVGLAVRQFYPQQIYMPSVTR